MGSTIKIHVMKCGEVGVDPAVPTRDVSKNPIAFTGLFRSPKRQIWLPVFTYLIDHPFGNILVDTSWSKDVRTNPRKAESFKLLFASKPNLPEGKSVDEQLISKGITAESLDYVFLTHMDVDHVNGIQSVKDAKHIMASKEEIDAANKGKVRYWKKQWKGIRFDEFLFNEDKKSGKKVFDVFGDGTVSVIFTPGHSAGSITILVKNNDKSVLIAGDTGYLKSSWRELRLPGPVYNKSKMKEALQWINSIEQNSTTILASHDPEIEDQIIEL